jgi:hypothetical protein
MYEYGGEDLDKYFFQAFSSSSKPATLGDVWSQAMDQFVVNKVIPLAQYYYAFIHIHKVTLFGDPSLRLGGIPYVLATFSKLQTAYSVLFHTTSTITNCQYQDLAQKLVFTVQGPEGTTGGFINMTIPKDLLVPIDRNAVLFDGATIPYEISMNLTHTFIYFKFPHSSHQIVILGDNTPPTTQLTIEPPKYDTLNQTYVTKNTQFELTANDFGSGVNETAYRLTNLTPTPSYDTGWIFYNAPFTLTSLSDGAYNLAYNSTDNAGNVESTNTAAIVVDNTPSSTSLAFGSPQYQTSKSTFITHYTPITLLANDGSGSGVATSFIRIWNGTYSSGWQTYSTPFSLASIADGNYTVSYFSVDNVGNKETEHAINITLFSWTYVFTDSYGRGTMLRISTQYKLFDLTVPGKDFGTKIDPHMLILKTNVIQFFSDKSLSLSVAADGKTGVCLAVALDKQTCKIYLLITKCAH